MKNAIYLFYGENEYEISSRIKQIKESFKNLEIGINYLYLEKNNLNEIIPFLETPTFLQDKKLIIVRNSEVFKSKKKDSGEENEHEIELTNTYGNTLSEYFKSNIDYINSNAIIVFYEEDVSKTTKLYKTISNVGKCEEIKNYSNIELINKINLLFKENNCKTERTIPNQIIETVGNNFYNIKNEIDKLVCYVDKNEIITEEIFNKVVVSNVEEDVFKLINYQTEGNTKKAHELYRNLIKQNTPEQKILILLYKNYKRLYKVAIALKNNINITKAAKLTNNQLWLEPKLINQAKKIGIEKLNNILKTLIKLDEKSKTYTFDLAQSLEILILN